MYLIPQPQKLDFHPKQSYTISYDQKIVIHPSCGSDGDIPARLLQKELQDMLGCRLAVTKGSSARTAVLFSMAGSQDGASVPAQGSCRNLSVPSQDSCCNLSVPAQDSCCNLRRTASASVQAQGPGFYTAHRHCARLSGRQAASFHAWIFLIILQWRTGDITWM